MYNGARSPQQSGWEVLFPQLRDGYPTLVVMVCVMYSFIRRCYLDIDTERSERGPSACRFPKSSCVSVFQFGARVAQGLSPFVNFQFDGTMPDLADLVRQLYSSIQHRRCFFGVMQAILFTSHQRVTIAFDIR
jgi:hypothetical protein